MGFSPGGSCLWIDHVGPDALVRAGEGLAVRLGRTKEKPGRAALRRAGEGTRPYVGRGNKNLLRCFLLDHDLEVGGHVLVQLDGDGKFTHCLERFVDLNFPAVHFKTLLGQRIRDIAGRD